MPTLIARRVESPTVSFFENCLSNYPSLSWILMRNLFALVALCTGTALCVAPAFADEPAACYVLSDPTGDLAPGKVVKYDPTSATGANIVRSSNDTNRAVSKCIQRHVESEAWPPGGASLVYGLRITPEGKITQVSLIDADNMNDARMIACIGRIMCTWEGAPDAQGQEQRVSYRLHLDQRAKTSIR
ncbi:MAG: hypothetical protein ACJ8GW_13435 [Massilia sp.]